MKTFLILSIGASPVHLGRVIHVQGSVGPSRVWDNFSKKTCPRGSYMAQGFISGFLRGLGTGAVALSALSIYVGINAQGDDAPQILAKAHPGSPSQPNVQIDPPQTDADPDPRATSSGVIPDDDRTDDGSISQNTQSLGENPTPADAGGGQVDENQSEIQSINL